MTEQIIVIDSIRYRLLPPVTGSFVRADGRVIEGIRFATVVPL